MSVRQHTQSSFISTRFHYFGFQFSAQCCLNLSVLLEKFFFSKCTLGKLTRPGRNVERCPVKGNFLNLRSNCMSPQHKQHPGLFKEKKKKLLGDKRVSVQHTLSRVFRFLFCFLGSSTHIRSLNVFSVCLIPCHRVILYLQSSA